MNNNIIDASEAASGEVPANPDVVAELSAEKRAGRRMRAASSALNPRGETTTPNVHTLAQPILEMVDVEVIGQREGPQACPACELTCLGSLQLSKHIADAHAALRVRWICAGCQRSCQSIHSWSCHLPHCSGPSPPQTYPFACDHCQTSYRTKRGLSQHERLAHPDVRNEQGFDGEVNIKLERGVKQGDPLSPLLFNLAIEPLLEHLEITEGIKVAHANLAVMAFADDIVCLAKDASEADRQIQMVLDFVGSLDMKISVEKCGSCQIVPSGKTWFVRDPGLMVNGSQIPFIRPGEITKYLGVHVNTWSGRVNGMDVDALSEVILRLRRLPLKPRQKFGLLVVHILPKYFYGLMTSMPAMAVLREIDRVLKSQVKQIFHLLASESDYLLHTPKRLGGLGLLEIQKCVPIAILRNGLKARASQDPVTREAMSSDDMEMKLSSYARSLRLPWPLTLSEVDAYKRSLGHAYARNWAKQLWQGQGVHIISRDRVCNEWLKRDDLLSESRFIDALKLRANIYPTRSLYNNINRNADPRCRRCYGARESLGHILGQCPTTKAKRIHRHDEIKNLLRNHLARDNRVLDEPELTAGGKRLKPDLVVCTVQERVLVLDVTVRYEHREYLSAGSRSKIEKYSCLLPLLRKKFRAQGAEVVTVVIGSRGAIPLYTKRALELLKLPKKD